MQNYLTKEHLVLSSACDAEGRLGIRNIFDICMDLAAHHAALLGVGYYEMRERGCYWVAVRTRVRLYDRPRLGDLVELETWPGKPGLAKMDRFYRVSADGRVRIEGRTEWAVQDAATGAVRRAGSFGYPTELVPRDERVCAEPFTRFKDEEGAAQLERAYTVGSMDIDVGRHMNNVAYIRMLMDTFTTAELAAMDITEVEISYRRACFEGETVRVLRRREADGWYFRVVRPDGETAVHAAVRV